MDRARRLVPLMAVAAIATGCGGEAPSGVATNPPPGQGIVGQSGSPTSGAQAGGARTVLSPIGINIRSADDKASQQIGTAAQGTLLTVLDRSDRNGGWFKVRGQSTTGWITADPDLTAPGHFSPYSVESPQFNFGALYPDGWTFSNENGEVLFRPQTGTQVIIVHEAASFAALGPAGRGGYSATTQADEVICGVTGTRVDYDRQGAVSASSTPAPAAPGTAPPPPPPSLAHYSQLRLRLDPAHAMELDHAYDATEENQAFRDFFNSVTFPFPQCQGPASPVPVAPVAPVPAGSIP